MTDRRPIPNDFNIENARPPYPDYPYFDGAEQNPFRANATVFDLVNAWWLIEAATLAYAELEFAKPRFQDAGMDKVEYVANGGTECYVAHNEEFAIVAFRGTEARALDEGSPGADFSNVVTDVVTDARIKLVDSGQGGKVHEGFKTGLDQVWDKLCPHLSSLAADGKKLWFTGHSLGAALATLAADRFGNVSGLYTYGSPRVGDESFAEDFWVPTYRFVNNNDVVGRVPPPPLFVHVGELKYIDHEGRIHDNASRLERLVDRIEGRVASIFNAVGNLRIGFKGNLSDGIVDHIPTCYATHIWNALP